VTSAINSVAPDAVSLIVGTILVLFWKQIGFAAAWLQERLMRPLGIRGEYTTGRELRATQLLCLIVGIVFLVSSAITILARSSGVGQ
jgi:hypothetical protein